jgi:hypothetical protein
MAGWINGRFDGLSRWISELSRLMNDGFSRLDRRIDRVDECLERRMDARFALLDERIDRLQSKR